jgi:hypothetical protein
MTTIHGSGDPSPCDGSITVPASVAQLSAIGLGNKLYAQVFTLDPLQPDGTLTSQSDGLWFEVTP